MDTLRDEHFTRQDEDEYGLWLEELQNEETDAYLIALAGYYGNRIAR